MSWTAISGIMPVKIQHLKLGVLFGLARLKNDWDKVITEIVGEKFAKKSKPINLKNNVLMVDCLNSVWANELKMRETRILLGVKNYDKELKISKISFIS